MQKERPDLVHRTLNQIWPTPFCTFPIWPGCPGPSSGTKGLTREERIPLLSPTLDSSSEGQGPQDRAREADPATPEAPGFSLSLLLLSQCRPLPRTQHGKTPRVHGTTTGTRTHQDLAQPAHPPPVPLGTPRTPLWVLTASTRSPPAAAAPLPAGPSTWALEAPGWPCCGGGRRRGRGAQAQLLSHHPTP